MKRNVTAVLGAAVMVLWASAASAQGMAGKWAMDMEMTRAANPAQGGGQGGGGGAGGGGGRQGGMGMGGGTIMISATEIVTTRPGPDGAETSTTVKVDGTEQTVTMGRSEAKVKATKDGDKITVVTTRETPNGAMATTAVYMMESENLVIATTSPARGGGEPTTRKVFYKRAS